MKVWRLAVQFDKKYYDMSMFGIFFVATIFSSNWIPTERPPQLFCSPLLHMVTCMIYIPVCVWYNCRFHCKFHVRRYMTYVVLLRHKTHQRTQTNSSMLSGKHGSYRWKVTHIIICKFIFDSYLNACFALQIVNSCTRMAHRDMYPVSTLDVAQAGGYIWSSGIFNRSETTVSR